MTVRDPPDLENQGSLQSDIKANSTAETENLDLVRPSPECTEDDGRPPLPVLHCESRSETTSGQKLVDSKGHREGDAGVVDEPNRLRIPGLGPVYTKGEDTQTVLVTMQGNAEGKLGETPGPPQGAGLEAIIMARAVSLR